MPLSCFYIIYFHTRTRTIIVHIRRYSIGEGGGNMLEYEKKMLLTEEEYFKFLHLIGKEKPRFIQTNYYYDTDDLKMNMQGITCRIREKNGKYEATIKSHKQGNKDCSIEKTKEVLNKYDDSLFSGMHLKLQGSLTTERVTVYSDNRCEVALDKNTYLDMTDYEMEVEYLPEHEEYATNLMYRYMSLLYPLKLFVLIFPQRVSMSKSERFFERKQNQCKGDKL